MTYKRWPRALLLASMYMMGILGVVASGGGGGSGSDDEENVLPPPEPIISRELLDPILGAGDRFGQFVLILANGNIVVSDTFDSSVAANNGAVHMYKPNSSSAFASIYGDETDDRIGAGGIFALSNNNFVIVTPEDNVPGLLNAGSVRLVNGLTGAQIGSAIVPDVASDFVGSTIKTLPNNNFVIIAPFDDEGGIPDAGSVQQFHGDTGQPVGTKIAGDSAGDIAGDVESIVTVLVNGNYVISSKFDDEAVVDAGSVRLIDGSTGLQIGGTIAGDVVSDFLGSLGITPLSNGNFVVLSDIDDESGQVNAGSVRLFNGDNGLQIGTTITGDAPDDFDSSSITALINGNFVIGAPADDEAGVVGVGSVRLIDGVNGIQLGSTITGETFSDQIGASIVALPNSNFVAASRYDNESGVLGVGSVRLLSGVSGNQLGPTVTGDIAFDQVGSTVVALANNNYVIGAPADNEGILVNIGTVRLMDGTTGNQIGTTLVGDTSVDQLGSLSITPLLNNNYVIASEVDDEGGVVDSGSIRLVDGTTGSQIGSAIVGDIKDDFASGVVTPLANNNFVVAVPLDNEAGITDAGAVRLVDGDTGIQVGTAIVGDTASDQMGGAGVYKLVNSNYVIVSTLDNQGGVGDAGSVIEINGTTGAQNGSTIAGSFSDDVIQAMIIDPANGDFYVLSLSMADNNGLMDSGFVYLSAQ